MRRKPKNGNKRTLQEYNGGVITSGRTYYRRVYPVNFHPKFFSATEEEELSTPHSYLRVRLAMIIRQRRRKVELKDIIGCKEASKVRYSVMEY